MGNGGGVQAGAPSPTTTNPLAPIFDYRAAAGHGLLMYQGN